MNCLGPDNCNCQDRSPAGSLKNVFLKVLGIATLIKKKKNYKETSTRDAAQNLLLNPKQVDSIPFYFPHNQPILYRKRDSSVPLLPFTGVLPYSY